MINLIGEILKAVASFLTGIPANWDELSDDWDRQRLLDDLDEYE